MAKWNIEPLELVLKNPWKLSRGEWVSKKNFLITFDDGDVISHGEVAFNPRYDESEELVLDQFSTFMSKVPNTPSSCEELMRLCKELDLIPSLSAGIDMAFLNYLSLISDTPISGLIGTNPVANLPTSYTVPIMPIEAVKAFIDSNQLSRFPALKIKVNNETAVDLMNEVSKSYQGKIRIDANEGFSSIDEVLKFSESIDCNRVDFIEQPLPAHFHDEYIELKKVSPLALVADESITNGEINSYHAERFHGVNIKLMKAGSLLSAKRQLKQANEIGLFSMIGCMIETSIGISAVMHLGHGVKYCDLDGFLLVENEPYGLLSEEKGRVFFSHLH